MGAVKDMQVELHDLQFAFDAQLAENKGLKLKNKSLTSRLNQLENSMK